MASHRAATNTNTNTTAAAPATTTTGGLDNFQFTFESYPNDGSRIEPDPNPIVDEAFDSESLSESIARFEEENGRTYHSYRSGSYHYPNDATETERLEDQFEILKMVLDGRNYLAPLSQKQPPRRVLDIATGTGTWAIEMGDEFPDAQIVGTDLSPIQPSHVPPNVRFFVEDSAEEWDYPHDFDYIHTRITLGCWSDPKLQIIQRAFDHLQPGGWYETQEVHSLPRSDDGTIPEDSAFLRWILDINSASESADRVFFMGDQLAPWLREVGFVNVQEAVFKIPINGWPRERALKHVGLLWQRNLVNGMSGFSLGLLHRVRGRTLEEIEVSLVDVRRDVFDQNMHAYQKLYVVWGQKPPLATSPRPSPDQ